MRKFFKFLGITLLVFILTVIISIGYITYSLPNVGKAPNIKIAATPDRIERGKYLANSVAVCIDCHSKRDAGLYAIPLINGTEGSGGEKFDRSFGFPGTFYARNITPYHLKNWTDGELFRVITTGVNKDGKALFPIMPYHYYGQLDTEDIYSIIAYIRTLPEIKNDIPESTPDFPFNIILHTIPKKAIAHTKPSPNDSVKYGQYLVTMCACVECHTNVKQGQIIPGVEFAGGREFNLPCGIIRSANITPDKSGLADWDKAQFISRFKMYQSANYHPAKVTEKDFNTIMPWSMYSKMTESDLSSIYQYLRTIKPIKNSIDKFTPRT